MSENAMAERDALISALTFYLDSGVSDFCAADAHDMRDWKAASAKPLPSLQMPAAQPFTMPPVSTIMDEPEDDGLAPLGKAEAIDELQALFSKVESVDALRQALEKFNGLGIKKTARNMVFAEGFNESPLMVISEFPQDEEDETGHPFAGAKRKIISYALNGIDRAIEASAADKGVYTTSFLNWRPPGNRSPQEVELEISRLILDKHIALVKPKAILMLGNITCKTMLGCSTNINKLRGNWQVYKTECAPDISIPVMPSYAPSALLGNGKNKGLFWQDLLQIKAKINA